MMLRGHFLAAVIVALCGIGTALYASSSAAMDLKMAVTSVSGMEMPDCDGCDAGGGSDPAAACDSPCVPPAFTAMAVDPPTLPSMGRGERRSCADPRLAGRTGPPDHHPPRSSVLI